MDKKIKNNILGKLVIVIWIILLVLSACGIIVNADTTDPGIPPGENQYFELRATEIKKDVNGKRQVIMELWGYNIEFKRIRGKI